MQNLKEQREYYDTIKKVFCKCINEDVIFNAKGFHHLFYEGTGKARTQKEVSYRLDLVPLIIPVIKTAEESSRRNVTRQPSRRKKGGKREIEYISLTALVGKGRNTLIKVILRKVGNGQIHFWSVMRLNNANKKHQSND